MRGTCAHFSVESPEERSGIIHEGAGMLLRWEAVVLEKGATLSSTVQRKQEGRGVSPGGGQRGVAHREAPVGSKRRLRL